MDRGCYKKENPLASKRELVSTPVDDPLLGPSVSIFIDPTRALRNALFDTAYFVVAAIGILLGIADASTNSVDLLGVTTPGYFLGLAEIAGSIVIAVWGLRAFIINVRMFRDPLLVVVGREGFDFTFGHGPVMWNEVETISDPGARGGSPGALRVFFSDPEDYEERHELSAFDRLVMRLAKDSITLATTNILPVDQVETLMLKRLQEYRHPQTVRAASSGSSRPKAARLPKS